MSKNVINKNMNNKNMINKKVLGLAMSLIMAMMLAGCGDNSSDSAAISGGTANSAGTSTSSTQGTDNGAGNSGSTEASQATKGYVFVFQGTEVAIDADMAPVLAALGEPKSYFEAASCAFQGLDKQYNYGSFEIDTYPDGDIDRVSAIYFYDDTVATQEGVAVFNSEADMKAAYGEDYKEVSGEIVYSKDGMKLCFIVEEGEITSIRYSTTALDE